MVWLNAMQQRLWLAAFQSQILEAVYFFIQTVRKNRTFPSVLLGAPRIRLFLLFEALDDKSVNVRKAAVRSLQDAGRKNSELVAPMISKARWMTNGRRRVGWLAKNMKILINQEVDKISFNPSTTSSRIM